MEIRILIEHPFDIPDPVDVVPDHRPKSGQPICPKHEPELQRPESPPEGNGQFAVVDDLEPAIGLKVFGTLAQRSPLRAKVGQELNRTVKLRTDPLVRIHDN